MFLIYTIIMDKNKQLITTVKQILYQRENLADKIQILIPPIFQDIDLSNWSVVLKYVDQANVPHAEILQKDDELYKQHLRYFLPVDTELTKYAGNITIRLTLTSVDLSTKTQYVLHSGETSIMIAPLKDYYAFVPNESLEFVDQLVGILDTKIEATEKIAETYNSTKADGLFLENRNLQLTSNGQKIGNIVCLDEDNNEPIEEV